MRIPASSVDAAAQTLTSFSFFTADTGVGGDNGQSKLQEWSSLIGICCALIGNVLISFALNTQRYAHIRIEREFNESRLPMKKRSKRPQASNTRGGYGTVQQQASIAEERLHANLQPEEGESHERPGNGSSLDKTHLAAETDPLNRSLITGSDDTLTPAEKLPQEGERKTYLKSPYWWAGIIMMTIGEAGNFIAYGFAPASIVSPLGVVALVSNCLIAPLMLKERFRWRDAAGVFVAVAGAVVVVLSAKNSEDKMGPDDLWEAIKRWEFLAYLLITAVLIVILMWASGKYGHRSILIDLGLVGLFGGYTALSTKGVASLLSYTLFRALTFPITYILVAVLVGSAMAQIRYVNRALMLFDSTQVIPTQFVCFTLSVIIGSAVLYRDFEAVAAERVGKFVGGCALTFLGVFLITGGRSSEYEDEDGLEELSDEDEGIHLIDEEAEERVDQEGEHGLSSQLERRLLPSAEIDGPTLRRPSTRGSVTSQRPIRTNRRAPSEVPSIAVTPESEPSPFASVKGNASPWDNEPSRPTPRLQTTQSTTQIETSHMKNSLAVASTPSLIRMPSAPSGPTTPRPGTGSASPSKADPSAHLRITGAADAPPATPSRSLRNSISHLIPGPLVSPLSSQLSAVVADKVRRGEGTSYRNRIGLRRNRPSTRSQRDPRRRSTAGDEEPLLRTQSHYQTDDGVDILDPSQENDADMSPKDKKNRFRSFSDTIGSLMKGKRRRKGGDEEEGGEDDGLEDQA